jgi:hypothetical protein
MLPRGVPATITWYSDPPNSCFTDPQDSGDAIPGQHHGVGSATARRLHLRAPSDSADARCPPRSVGPPAAAPSRRGPPDLPRLRTVLVSTFQFPPGSARKARMRPADTLDLQLPLPSPGARGRRTGFETDARWKPRRCPSWASPPESLRPTNAVIPTRITTRVLNQGTSARLRSTRRVSVTRIIWAASLLPLFSSLPPSPHAPQPRSPPAHPQLDPLVPEPLVLDQPDGGEGPHALDTTVVQTNAEEAEEEGELLDRRCLLPIPGAEALLLPGASPERPTAPFPSPPTRARARQLLSCIGKTLMSLLQNAE